MEKITVTIARFLQNEESLRTVYKEKLNAEKEVNRAMAGFKKDGTYAASDADVVLELMNKMEKLQKYYEELSTEGVALKEMLIKYLVWLTGSVDFHKDEHSIINFSLNDHNELVIHPNQVVNLTSAPLAVSNQKSAVGCYMHTILKNLAKANADAGTHILPRPEGRVKLKRRYKRKNLYLAGGCKS